MPYDIQSSFGPGGNQVQTQGGLNYGGGAGGQLGAFDLNGLLEWKRMMAERAFGLKERAADLENKRGETEYDQEHQGIGQRQYMQKLAMEKAQRDARQQEYQAQAMSRLPEREYQTSRPGVSGGYGGFNPYTMNAYQRQAYLPQNSESRGGGGTLAGPGPTAKNQLDINMPSPSEKGERFDPLDRFRQMNAFEDLNQINDNPYGGGGYGGRRKWSGGQGGGGDTSGMSGPGSGGGFG